MGTERMPFLGQTPHGLVRRAIFVVVGVLFLGNLSTTASAAGSVVSFSSPQFVDGQIGNESQLKVTLTGINDFGVVGTTNGEGTLSANAVTHGIAYAASSCYPYPTYAYRACTIDFTWTPSVSTTLSATDTYTIQVYDAVTTTTTTEVITFSGSTEPCYTVSGNILTSGAACVGVVFIRSGITSIAADAFSGNSLITSVTMPNGVTSIGSKAFYNSANLVTVNMPNSITSIGSQAFQACTKLETAVLPSGITAIPDFLYLGASSLSNIGSIPSGVTSIGTYALNGTALASLTIPNSVTSLGANFAANNPFLASVTFGTGVTAIPDSAFNQDPILSVVNIPVGVTTIGPLAFGGDYGITSLTLPNSLTSIGSQAFDGPGPPSLICVNASVATYALYSGWRIGLTRCNTYTVASSTASPTSAAVPVGYGTGTSTTVTMTRDGITGANPTVTLSVTGGTWTVGAVSGTTVSNVNVTSAAPVTITLTAATGTYVLGLTLGAGAGTYTASDNATTPLSYAVTVSGATNPYTIASSIASPSSASVKYRYSGGTSTTVRLTRAGSSGSNPTTTLSVTGGTWTVTVGRGVSASSTTVRSGAPVTITLTAATGSYTLSLNTGAAVGRYTATDTATRRLNYVVTVGASKRDD